MALRFRKSIKLAPGVRLNLGKKSASLTVGVKGASVNIGSKGAYLNTGIPGSGISLRQKISTSRPAPKIKIDTGAIKKERDKKLAELRKQCAEHNEVITTIEKIHLDTPSPFVKPKYIPAVFQEHLPTKPRPKKCGLFGLLSKKTRESISKENQEREAEYQENVCLFFSKRDTFQKKETELKKIIEVGIYESLEDMEYFLEFALQKIIWPRETLCSVEIVKNGDTILIDVDLPEIEDMPNETLSVSEYSLKLSTNKMMALKIQLLYKQHVHAIGFRIIGETFSSLPKVSNVIFSGFSQRPNKKTGNIEDEYLYSLKVNRSDWEKIDFSNINKLNIIQVLSNFDIVRNMTSTGDFYPINPLGINDC